MRKIKASLQGNTFVNALFVIVFIGFFVGFWLYLPVITGGLELDKMTREYTLRSSRFEIERLHQMFLEEAEYKHDIYIYDEDLLIFRENKRIIVDVIWRPIVVIPLINKEIELEKRYKYDRVTY